MTPQGIVYLVGVALLGLAYERLKRATGGGWIFGAVVLASLVGLRLVGAWLASRVEPPEDAEPPELPPGYPAEESSPPAS